MLTIRCGKARLLSTKRKEKLSPLALLLCFLWIKETLFAYCVEIIKNIPILNVVAKYIPGFVTGTLLMVALQEVVWFVKKQDLIIYLIIVAIGGAIVLFPNEYTDAFQSYYVTMLAECLPVYFLGLAIPHYLDSDGNEYLIKVFIWLSRLSVISIIIINGIFGSTIIAEWSNDQYHAYLMLPSLALVVASYFKRRSLLDLCICVAGSVFLLLSGCRGAVVCLLVYIIYWVVKLFKKMRFKWKAFSLCICVMAIAFIYSNYYELFLFAVDDFAKQMNMSTRLTQFFITGAISDSGRSGLYSIIASKIHENPLGYGPASAWYFINMYTHNLFLELVLDFGIFLGAAVIILFITKFLKAHLFSRKRETLNEILWLLFICSVVKLMFSGTYLSEPYLYLFIGFTIGTIRRCHVSLIKERNGFGTR